ncbi:MAG: hypothetical protein ACKORL_11215, partial [Phycisphaerales bacterium]
LAMAARTRMAAMAPASWKHECTHRGKRGRTLRRKFRSQHACRAARALGLYDCTRLAVEAHAIAGERWAERAGGTAGMLAAELAAEIPAALASMRTLVFP